MSELDEIFPAARIKVFTGEYKLYTDMSEFDKEIEEVDVYSKEQVLKLLEPQLTIPKSIADELDGYFKYIHPFEAILKDNSVRINDVVKENRDYLAFLHSNIELCIIYLAGKALGVDLVKVGEG